MPVLKSLLGRGFGFGLIVALSVGFWATSLADMVHFANGNSVRGKLDRLTGDIIEFKRAKHLFGGSLDYFKRIQLTDRHDVAETRDGHKYFGEIIYLDGFVLEIQTASGAVRLNRMSLTNVVLGSPLQPPKVPAMNQLPIQQGSQSTMSAPEPPVTMGLEQPAVRTEPMTYHSSAGMPSPGEDEDVMPAVDSGYNK